MASSRVFQLGDIAMDDKPFAVRQRDPVHLDPASAAEVNFVISLRVRQPRHPLGELPLDIARILAQLAVLDLPAEDLAYVAEPVEDVARQPVQLENGVVHLNDVAVRLEQRHARRQIVEHEPAHLGFTRDVLFLFLERGHVAHDDEQVSVRSRMEVEFGPNPVRHLPDMRTVAACQG